MRGDSADAVPGGAGAGEASRGAPRILDLGATAGLEVGGKAAGLAELIRLGLPVPRGFVVVDARPGHLPAELGARYRALGGGRVAVRSSALGEDSAEASFAGQYETVLDVEGEAAVEAAVLRCLDSLESRRASAYRAARDERDGPSRMCVVVQRMVDARAAGVLFTADPVSGRRGRSVIDAVEGLGEELVSGRASPDHYVLDRSGATREQTLTASRPVLAPEERAALLAAALRAERAHGAPLDLEWAVDREGRIHWLQARPITQLGADPNELDTPVGEGHVYTRCNVGEMFPGACTPLSFSFTARAIDVGMQMMHRRVGIQSRIEEEFRFVAMFHGHLFLDLTTMSDTATQALGSDADMMAQALCGRPLTELELVGRPPPPWPRRIANGGRYLGYLFSRGRARRALAALAAELRIPEADTALEQWRGIDARMQAIYDAMDHHLVSSAASGVLTPTLLRVLAKGEEPGDAHHAEVARLLAGAGGVESADIAKGAERVQEAIAAHPEADAAFVSAEPEQALAWLRHPARSGAAGHAFAGYLARHGHRAIKELELRQREWREDPLPLVRSLQVPLRAGVGAAERGRSAARAPLPKGALGWLVRLARHAVQCREETKSGLVAVTTRFKEGYRALARRLVDEGLLADEDLVYFLRHDELGRLAAGERELAHRAAERRELFPYQAGLEFPDVFQGEVEPLSPEPPGDDVTSVSGAPVSRGTVEGRVRVVRSLVEAEALQRGEILVAPITDVGWTPYFALIAGLVTDVGSAVSHGAVVAREYGLPAVVNTRFATQVFRTGDRVRLDAERGLVERLDD